MSTTTTPPVGVQPAGNGLAIAALVCGIIGVLCGLIPLLFFLALVLGVLAVVFGLIGRRRPVRRAMATWGAAVGVLAIILGIVGVVIVSNATDKLGRDLKNLGGNGTAISNHQARSIPIGTPRSQVLAQLGKPDSSDETQDQALGSSSCVYYHVQAKQFTQWQFCFDGKGKLTSKNRL